MRRIIKFRNDPPMVAKEPGLFTILLRALLIALGVGVMAKLLVIQIIRVTH